MSSDHENRETTQNMHVQNLKLVNKKFTGRKIEDWYNGKICDVSVEIKKRKWDGKELIF